MLMTWGGACSDPGKLRNDREAHFGRAPQLGAHPTPISSSSLPMEFCLCPSVFLPPCGGQGKPHLWLAGGLWVNCSYQFQASTQWGLQERACDPVLGSETWDKGFWEILEKLPLHLLKELSSPWSPTEEEATQDDYRAEPWEQTLLSDSFWCKKTNFLIVEASFSPGRLLPEAQSNQINKILVHSTVCNLLFTWSCINNRQPSKLWQDYGPL